MSHSRQSSLDLLGITTGSSSSHRNTSHIGTSHGASGTRLEGTCWICWCSWRADEVGFFCPDLHHSYGTSDIVTIGKELFYRNATVFLDRLDDIVKVCGGEVVRNNIPTCLCGAALQGYTT